MGLIRCTISAAVSIIKTIVFLPLSILLLPFKVMLLPFRLAAGVFRLSLIPVGWLLRAMFHVLRGVW